MAEREEIRAMFHRLWTKAVGTPDYVKREWQKLEEALDIAGPTKPQEAISLDWLREINERSKDDRAIIVGSEVRMMVEEIFRLRAALASTEASPTGECIECGCPRYVGQDGGGGYVDRCQRIGCAHEPGRHGASPTGDEARDYRDPCGRPGCCGNPPAPGETTAKEE
jgi:hypothetical protein